MIQQFFLAVNTQKHFRYCILNIFTLFFCWKNFLGNLRRLCPPKPAFKNLWRVRVGERMIRGIESILIGSGNASKLAKFYREVIGLKQTMEFEMGDNHEEGFAFEGKGYSIVIMDHSKVKSKNILPDR